MLPVVIIWILLIILLGEWTASEASWVLDSDLPSLNPNRLALGHSPKCRLWRIYLDRSILSSQSFAS